jgi:hypothetical protein
MSNRSPGCRPYERIVKPQVRPATMLETLLIRRRRLFTSENAGNGPQIRAAVAMPKHMVYLETPKRNAGSAEIKWNRCRPATRESSLRKEQ